MPVRTVGAVVSLLVGGVIGAVTLVGIVTHGLNTAGSNPGSVNATIPYGSTQ